MRRSTRDIIGGLAIIALSVLVYWGFRVAFARLTSFEPDELSEQEREAIAKFENDRKLDSVRQQAYWDSLHSTWAAEKAERQNAKALREAAQEQRELAYADSQRVWAARREQWAAEKAERKAAAEARQAHYDSIKANMPQKLPKGSTLDANSASEEQLMQIPGIGATYAHMIVEYRNALGGFTNPKQLDEISNLPHGISTWFRVANGAAAQVKRININRADFKALVHHPYLSYEQTKAIVNLRQRIGKLRDWSDLRGSGLFSDQDVERLRPYFVF